MFYFLKIFNCIIPFIINDPFFLLRQYMFLLLFLFFAVFLSCLLAFIPYLYSRFILRENETLSEYECGSEPFDNAIKQPFTVHFYLVGILFLLFDVEICLFFPWVLIISLCGWSGFFLILFFLCFLILGFIYEWQLGVVLFN